MLSDTARRVCMYAARQSQCAHIAVMPRLGERSAYIVRRSSRYSRVSLSFKNIKLTIPVFSKFWEVVLSTTLFVSAEMIYKTSGARPTGCRRTRRVFEYRREVFHCQHQWIQPDWSRVSRLRVVADVTFRIQQDHIARIHELAAFLEDFPQYPRTSILLGSLVIVPETFQRAMLRVSADDTIRSRCGGCATRQRTGTASRAEYPDCIDDNMKRNCFNAAFIGMNKQ